MIKNLNIYSIIGIIIVIIVILSLFFGNKPNLNNFKMSDKADTEIEAIETEDEKGETDVAEEDPESADPPDE